MTHRHSSLLRFAIPAILLCITAPAIPAQSPAGGGDVEQLRQMVLNLEQRVAALEEQNRQLRQAGAPADASGPQAAAALALASAELRGGPADAATPAPTDAARRPLRRRCLEHCPEEPP